MKQPLDIYDDMPKDMKRYISNYGWHFNRKAYEYAVSMMKKRSPKTGLKEAVEPFTKEEVDLLLEEHKIKLSRKYMYDYVYVATMCRADYFGSSIEDNKHLALFIKDTIDDVDASDGTTFRRFLATSVGNGLPIDWAELI